LANKSRGAHDIPVPPVVGCAEPDPIASQA
jgi:hypothetical protein